MSVDESRRLLRHDAARDAWGAEAALVLMEMLPPTGWADVATKRDLQHLEVKLDALEDHTDSRFAMIDARFDAVEARLDAKLEAGFRRMIQWNVAALLTGLAAFTAIVRLT